jgi:hypothetical protein
VTRNWPLKCIFHFKVLHHLLPSFQRKGIKANLKADHDLPTHFDHIFQFLKAEEKKLYNKQGTR